MNLSQDRWHCFFCGSHLAAGLGESRWICTGCKAEFEATLDKSGCVVHMQVCNCGTPDCCREPKNALPPFAPQ